MQRVQDLLTQSESRLANVVSAFETFRDELQSVKPFSDGRYLTELLWAQEELQAAIAALNEQSAELTDALLERVELLIEGIADEPHCELANRSELTIQWTSAAPIYRTIEVSKVFSGDGFDIEADLKFELQYFLPDESGAELVYEVTLAAFRTLDAMRRVPARPKPPMSPSKLTRTPDPRQGRHVG